MATSYENMKYSRIAGIYEEDHLEHHGIPGMKWGIRKEREPSGNRAAKKFAKYNEKSNKHLRKATEYKSKSDDLAGYKSKGVKVPRKLSKQYLKKYLKESAKSYKASAKAEKWFNKAKLKI